MLTAIEDDALLAQIAGLMDEAFTVEGAVYYLLGKHTGFTENNHMPASVYWKLSVGAQGEVLKELRELAAAAREGEHSGT